MDSLKALIKSTFELFCQMRWLRLIDKEIRKRDKLREKERRQSYVVQRLFQEYEKQYSKEGRE